MNQGFYQALIPGADATLLWGLTDINQAASALSVSETSSGEAASNVAVSSISVKNGNIIVSSTGFNFSSPKFSLKKNPKYKAPGSKKKKTITCVKGKKTKKVTALKPVCPTGYKKK